MQNDRTPALPRRKLRNSFRCLNFGAVATILLFLARGQTALAADGDLDPTFGTGGQVTTDFNHSTDIANAVALQPDGKLVVVGQTYTNNDYTGEDFASRATTPTVPWIVLLASMAR